MYSTGSGTSTRRKHLFQIHTQCYIEALECNHWPVYIPTLKQIIGDGWTLSGILQALKDPAKTIDSLGPPLIMELVTHSLELQDLRAMYYPIFR